MTTTTEGDGKCPDDACVDSHDSDDLGATRRGAEA